MSAAERERGNNRSKAAWEPGVAWERLDTSSVEQSKGERGR